MNPTSIQAIEYKNYLLKQKLEDDKCLRMLRTSMSEFIEYFDDPDVTEIMLNPDQTLWIEKKGEMINTNIKILPEKALNFISIVASTIKDVINSEKLYLSGELPIWGSRIEAFIPPAVHSPVFSIRQKAKTIYSLSDYVKQGIMTEKQKEIIIENVWKRSNILVIGGTGTGKTTLTNAILQEISKTGSRLLILEDTEELQCKSSNCVFLRQRENLPMRKLVQRSMRMRPDRIIVGEVTDGAALDLLKAWNTGHPGGISTIHANSAASGLIRLEQLIQEALPMPQRELIGEAVDIAIYIERTAKGRVIKEILQINGYKNNEYIYNKIA